MKESLLFVGTEVDAHAWKSAPGEDAATDAKPNGPDLMEGDLGEGGGVKKQEVLASVREHWWELHVCSMEGLQELDGLWFRSIEFGIIICDILSRK